MTNQHTPLLPIRVLCLLVILAGSSQAFGKPNFPPHSKTGQAGLAYEVAEKHEALLKNLFPYCGSDIDSKVSSLYDCFTSGEAEVCVNCQNEAIFAGGLEDKKVPVHQIQIELQQKFSSWYPYATPTEKYQKYLRKFNLQGRKKP